MNRLNSIIRIVFISSVATVFFTLVLIESADKLNVSQRLQSHIIAIGSYGFFLACASVLIWLIVSDIARNSLRNSLILYYLSLLSCLSGIVYIKYFFYMPGNGIIVVFPGITSIFLLLVITLMIWLGNGEKKLMAIYKSWGVFIVFSSIIFLITKLF
jgi:hypothetical protein